MLTPNYQVLWDSMVPDPAHAATILADAHKIEDGKLRYQTVGAQVCPTKPVPWYFIGLIHLMEGELNFHTHLYNGDPLTHRTVHYPRDKPVLGTPPFTWEYSAIDSLKSQGYAGPITWDTAMILRQLEKYNGRGYWSHDIYTPYLWSRTNHYTAGKFEEILNRQTQHYDVHFNPTLVSGQVGAAPILQQILLL